MMAAQLQIFMTNPASHTDCKGMWNLCVNLAVVVVVVVVEKKNYSVECRHCCGGHMSVSTKNHMAAAFTLISICPSFQNWQ